MEWRSIHLGAMHLHLKNYTRVRQSVYKEEFRMNKTQWEINTTARTTQ